MEQLIEIIQVAKRLIEAPGTDVQQTTYDSAEEFARDLDDHAERLRKGDGSRIKELVLLFAPTGALQEAAASSGWGDEYLELAHMFDQAIRQLASESE